MRNSLFAIVILLALGACASAGSRLTDDQRREIHRAHAGAPVRSFQNFGTLYSWAALGDSALTVWTRRHQAYLLELDGRCPDLDFSHTIGFSAQGGTVFAGMDSVVVLDRQNASFPCRIREIRPVDTKAVENAERRARESSTH
ncbi:hypothetical protein INQ40_04915 [Lysobacter sp. H21R4]|nr:hypothetical protein INQ40_04915 [Lysobacter sp. H21R4]